MKKTAKKKVSANTTSKDLDRGLVIPPDVLKGKISNETQKESEENVVAAKVKVDDVVNNSVSEDTNKDEVAGGDKNDKEEMQVTFYEKVTGQKPPQKEIPSANPDASLENERIISENELPQIEKLNRKLFLLGGVVFLLTIVSTSAIGFLIINNPKETKEELLQKVVQEEIAPTPTIIEIDKSEWTFEVLNGSGEGGKAKKTADAIESLGYKISNTGNTDRKDYVGVIVSFIAEIENSTKEIILKDLKKEFLISPSEEEVGIASNADIILIIGK